jgi:two-component system, cell cycle sensor histidine kinase and response regulator CckA
MGEMLRRIVGKRIAYTQTLAPDLPLILADKSMIEQIVLNLVVNARDAMTTGQLALSTFSLQVGPAEAAADKEARLGPAVCLQVADTGIGMSEQTIAHIFEPFFTTKAAGKGTGLGLSTVYSIVKQHKGWLTVKSEIDKGTTFSLYFPALDQSAVTAPSASAPSLSGHGETILLVEDEAALRGMAETILSGFNYRVLAAASGPDALQVWEKHRDEIHMLFTDIVMPQGMTGIDLAEKLLQDRPELKVIYTSGYRLEEIPRSMLIRETGHFVPKPYIPSVLARTLRQVLET